MSVKVYSAADLVGALARQFPRSYFVQGPAIMNGSYCAVTRRWVDGPFTRYYFDYLAARDQRKYSTRGNQCEHYAIRAALEAVELFRQAMDGEIPEEAESIGVAWFKYAKGGNLWHEANLWFLDGEWVPWEPQTLSFFTLTAAEHATVQQIAIP